MLTIPISNGHQTRHLRLTEEEHQFLLGKFDKRTPRIDACFLCDEARVIGQQSGRHSLSITPCNLCRLGKIAQELYPADCFAENLGAWCLDAIPILRDANFVSSRTEHSRHQVLDQIRTRTTMVDPIGCSEAKEEIARCFLTLPADIQAHSIRVAHTAGKSVHHPSFIVGLYHDLPEDTGIPMSVFYSVLTPSECAALFRVSRHWPFKHHRRRTYMDYINELAPCEIAWTVKMADLQDHVSPNRIDHIPKSQVDRYVTAIAYLREHNPKGVE